LQTKWGDPGNIGNGKAPEILPKEYAETEE